MHKKGSKKSPNNYRPVSLTSQVLKLFEKVIPEKCIHFCNKNNIFTSRGHHGFQSGCSCLTILLKYLNDWTSTYYIPNIYLFHSSKILKIEDMYKLQLLMFMFSYYRNILPSPLYSLFTRNCDIHDHYKRCRKDPRAVARNTHIMTKSFICKGPELWGELSQNTKDSKSLSSFKKQIKNIHINTYTN